MRTKERPQNVGEVYSSGRKELPAREAGLVYPPESALPSWGCDRGWRASATLRSRSTQEMDGGENKVDEMKVARPPVLAGPTTGHYLLLLIDGQPAGAVPWSAAPAARQQSSTKRRTVQAAPTRGVDLKPLATFTAPIRTCAFCSTEKRHSAQRAEYDTERRRIASCSLCPRALAAAAAAS
jgi:hypothetical protein